MSDGTVRVAPDSTGKYIDVSEIYNLLGTLVERQRVAIGDPTVAGNLAKATIDGELWVGGPHLLELLTAIVVELRIHSVYLSALAAPNDSDDTPDTLRADPSLQPN